MAVKPEEIYNKQLRLAQQLKLSQQAQAQTQFNQGQRALAEQLRANRIGTQQSRNSLQDQAFMTNRAIQQGTQARGLGNSGLKDAALIQAQLAQGKNINQLEQQNAEVQRAALGTRLGLDEALSGNIRASETQYMSNTLDAEREQYQRQQAQQENLLQLYQMAKEGASQDEIGKLATILGLDLNQLSPDVAEALGSASSVDFANSKTYSKKSRTMFGDIWEGLLTYLDPTNYAAWAARNLAGDKVNLSDSKGLASVANAAITGNLKEGTYTINGQKMRLTPQQAVQKVQEQFAGKPYIGKEITIGADKGGDIKFYVNGTGYASYLSAVNAINKARG